MSQMEKVNPPATLKVNEGFFIERIPVTNLMMVEFEVFKEVMREKGFTGIQEYLDYRATSSSELRIPTYYLESYNNDDQLQEEDYYENGKFLNHPVLTVSKETAADYCDWRTKMTRHLWRNDLESLYKVQVANKMNFRLPTLEELENATTVFDERGDHNYLKKSKIWNIRLTKEDERFTLYSIAEFTAGDEKFTDHLSKKDDFEYTGFRCICEIKN
jgi:hypothetical protein